MQDLVMLEIFIVAENCSGERFKNSVPLQNLTICCAGCSAKYIRFAAVIP